MDQETELIRQQMSETRESISEKVDALEQHVLTTIHDATDSVASTVDSVRDAVQGTVHSVSDSIEQTVDSVKEAFDIRRQVERHPWAMLAGAVLAGYFGGRLLASSRRPVAPASSSPGDRRLSESKRSEFKRVAPSGNEQGGNEQIGERFGPALDKLKGLAINASAGLIGDMILSSVSPSMRKEVAAVIDEFAHALGAQPLHKQNTPDQSPRGESMNQESSPRSRLAEALGDGRHV